jgi:hydroxymethylbilane synthase
VPRALIAGTRGSRLALRQTDLVLDALRNAHPDVEVEVRQIRTEGDRSDAPLSAIGGQGVFVKEIEAALLRKEIDFAVHSLKDLPPEIPERLVLAAIPERGDPRDALVTRNGAKLADLPPGAKVGTGSARRAVQLRALRHNIEPVDIRGNVETRIRKVDEGQYDGAVLAVAGLERLDLLDRASQIFSTDEMTPAVGQGALAVEARSADQETVALLQAVDHGPSRTACEAERAFLAELGAGCRLPVGAVATVDETTLRMRGFLSDDSGENSFSMDTGGSRHNVGEVGLELADLLRAELDEALDEASA